MLKRSKSVLVNLRWDRSPHLAPQLCLYHGRGRRKIWKPEYRWGCCEQTPGHDRAGCKCESTAALATCTWPSQYHSVDILAVMILGLLKYLYEQKSCWLFMAAKGGGGYHISLGMWLLIGTNVPVEWTTYLGIIFEQMWSREWAVF